MIGNYFLVVLLLNPLKSSIHAQTTLAKMEEHVLILEIQPLNASALRATLEIAAEKVRCLFSVCYSYIPIDAMASNSAPPATSPLHFFQPSKFVGKIKLSK